MNNQDDSYKITNDLENEYKKKKKKKVYSSTLRYKILIITVWIIFLISFIMGFVVHFKIESNITASSIIWTFSFILCLIGIIFSILYYKALRAGSLEKSRKFLKYLPI